MLAIEYELAIRKGINESALYFWARDPRRACAGLKELVSKLKMVGMVATWHAISMHFNMYLWLRVPIILCGFFI